MSARPFWLGVAAYIVSSFLIAYPWHLVVFEPIYRQLGVFRDDIIIPFGLLSLLIQGVAFSFAYPRIFSDRHSVLRNGLIYGLMIGLLSWTFTTLAVAAKNVMTSVPTYLALETGFTLLQFVVVGPLIALAHRK
jgi:hypothetical protein